MDVNLPPDLDRWLKSRADQIGVEPELLLHQLVDSYRTSGSGDEPADHLAEQFGGDRPADRSSGERSRDLNAAVLESLLDEKLDEWVAEDLEATIDDRVSETVEAELEDRLADAVEAALDARVEDAVAAELDGSIEPRIADAVETATTDFEDRLEELEADRVEAIEDVRDRVIQVKKETDDKASREAHEETRDRLDDLRADLGALDDRLDSLAETVSALEAETDRLDDHDDRLATLGEDVDGVEERLNTLAWNVNRVREYVDTATDLAPILEKAAQLDVDRAKCDRCDAAVDIGLLTEPACPHCSAALSGVVASRSFFGKPRLLVGDDAEQ